MFTRVRALHFSLMHIYGLPDVEGHTVMNGLYKVARFALLICSLLFPHSIFTTRFYHTFVLPLYRSPDG